MSLFLSLFYCEKIKEDCQRSKLTAKSFSSDFLNFFYLSTFMVWFLLFFFASLWGFGSFVWFRFLFHFFLFHCCNKLTPNFEGKESNLWRRITNNCYRILYRLKKGIVELLRFCACQAARIEIFFSLIYEFSKQRLVLSIDIHKWTWRFLFLFYCLQD